MDATPKTLPTVNVNELERLAVAQALAECGGNRIQTAIRMGKSVRWVRYRIIEYGLLQSLQSSPASEQVR